MKRFLYECQEVSRVDSLLNLVALEPHLQNCLAAQRFLSEWLTVPGALSSCSISLWRSKRLALAAVAMEFQSTLVWKFKVWVNRITK